MPPCYSPDARQLLLGLIAKRRNTVLPTLTLGSLPQQQRQWECRQTKGLMSKTIAVHVHCKSLYISLPFSTKQQGPSDWTTSTRLRTSTTFQV